MVKRNSMFDEKLIKAEEDLLIDFQFLIQDLIDKKNVSRSDLCRRAGISKARLSQILSPEANPTVKTFARLLWALDEKLSLVSNPIGGPVKSSGLGRWIQLDNVMPDLALPSKASIRREEELISAFETAEQSANDNYEEIETFDPNLLYDEAA